MDQVYDLINNSLKIRHKVVIEKTKKGIPSRRIEREPVIDTSTVTNTQR